MNVETKQLLRAASILANGIESIASAGSSGAGKTTSVTKVINPFSRCFIFTNIGAIQSSKIRVLVVPLPMNSENQECACIRIEFEDYLNIDIPMLVLKKCISYKVAAAGENFNDDDVEAILNELIKPKNRTYNITKYVDDDAKNKLSELIKNIAETIIYGRCEEASLKNSVENTKNELISSGKKADHKEIVSQEVDRRIGNADFSTILNEVKEIFILVKNRIIEKATSLYENYQDYIEVNYNSDNTNVDELVVYIDKGTGRIANEFFKFMFEKDGKDIVVSYLAYYAPMSSEMEDKLSQKRFHLNQGHPVFKIYDLKGLETQDSDSINETLMKLHESMPDTIIAFHSTTDTSNNFVNCIDAIHKEFPSVSVHAILTHADLAVKHHLRNKLQEFGAPMEDEDGYPEFKNKMILESYNAVQDESQCYKDAIDCGKVAGCKTIICSLVDECKELDDILGEDNKLYKTDLIPDLIAEICNAHKDCFKRVSMDPSVVQSITFNQEELGKIVGNFVSFHKAQASKKYFAEVKKNPHWNTVYKWRSMHRVGKGWSSSAKVYDNISINVSEDISGMMNKKDIINAIDINLVNVSTEQENDILKKLSENIEKDINLYNGFFTNIKLALSYDGIKESFESTYFSDALNLIYNRLNDSSYVESVMIKALEKYKEVYIQRTFC